MRVGRVLVQVREWRGDSDHMVARWSALCRQRSRRRRCEKGGARNEVDKMGDARQFSSEPTVDGEGRRRGNN